ncbi:MAG TPA: MATE family efflux transporter [Spirochaetia bacterium]|nr:MATE family efflux transporter [Spirochaetia bacterium]
MEFREDSPRSLRARWGAAGGYRSLLAVAVPLILSNGASSVQQFIDRMFLAWSSPEAMAAATPAGILNFTLMSLFINTAAYAGTFIAQYFGAGRQDRIGAVVWQTIYLSLAGAAVMAVISPFAGTIFRLIGHGPAIAPLEAAYFRILSLGALFPILTAGLSGFYAGQGRTWPVLWINLQATALNVILDYWLIFGGLGVPAMGISGAAIATVAATASGTIVLACMVFFRRDRKRFGIGRPRVEGDLLRRMVRYGVPSGLQVTMDVSGFTVFILLIGRLGLQSLAATNIALSVNMLAFMPVIGLGIAVSILVGQHIGDHSIGLAEYSVYSGVHLALAYMVCIAAAYLFLPHLFLLPYTMNAAPGEYDSIAATTRVLLRFVALYSIFDALNLTFGSGIKGAGDTRFVVLANLVLSVGVLIIPASLIILVFHGGMFGAWVVATAYVSFLGIVFYLRFRNGAWKKMRVIESPFETDAGLVP